MRNHGCSKRSDCSDSFGCSQNFDCSNCSEHVDSWLFSAPASLIICPIFQFWLLSILVILSVLRILAAKYRESLDCSKNCMLRSRRETMVVLTDCCNWSEHVASWLSSALASLTHLPVLTILVTLTVLTIIAVLSGRTALHTTGGVDTSLFQKGHLPSAC